MINNKNYLFSPFRSMVCGRVFTIIISLLFFSLNIHADEGSLQLNQLKSAITQAREELDQERRRIAEEQERLKGLVLKLRSERDSLSDSVIDLKISVKRGKDTASKLRKSVNSLKDDIKVKDKSWDQVSSLLKGSVGELKGLLKTVPPSARRDHKVEELCGLNELESEKEEISAKNVQSFFSTVLEVIREGQDIELYSDLIRTEQGALEKSDILRIGHIAAAYQLHSNKKLGLLIKGVEGQEGFRWKEDIPRYQRKKIVGIFDAAKNNHSGNFLFPVDVTQEIHPEIKQGNSGLFGFLSSGGLVMIPLIGIAVAALILITERLLFLRKERSIPDHMIENIVSLCAKGSYDDAKTICRQRRGPIARTIADCLSRRMQGIHAMEDSIQESIMHEIPRIERFLPAIGVLAAVAPLLGLLGTVTGMINTFNMITVFGSGNPRLMAGGISEALITTATGLVIAIPVLLMHNYLSTKVDGIICDIERYAATVFNALVIKNGS